MIKTNTLSSPSLDVNYSSHSAGASRVKFWKIVVILIAVGVVAVWAASSAPALFEKQIASANYPPSFISGDGAISAVATNGGTYSLSASTQNQLGSGSNLASNCPFTACGGWGTNCTLSSNTSSQVENLGTAQE